MGCVNEKISRMRQSEYDKFRYMWFMANEGKFHWEYSCSMTEFMNENHLRREKINNHS